MKVTKTIKLATLLSTVVLVFSCAPAKKGSDAPKYAPQHDDVIIEVPATRLYLATYISSSNIFVGSTRTLSPVVFPANAHKNIKYISENENIITVNEDGVLKGESEGTALITAYNDNNDNNKMDVDEPRGYACYSIKTPRTDTGIRLKYDELTVKVGEKVSIEATSYGSLSTSKFSNYVSDSTIATAYDNQVVGLKPGTTNLNVYASISSGEPAYEANCTIKVIDNFDSTGLRADGVSFKYKTIRLKVGEQYKCEYEITPKGTVDGVESLSLNNNICDLKNGVLTATRAGSAILTITTTNGKFDRAKVLVTDPKINYEDSYYNNYYGDLTWENGSDLKTKLHNIISQNKKSLTYDKNWLSSQKADRDLYNLGTVNAIYTDTPIDINNTQSGWQKEHAFAASLMTGIGTGDAIKTLGRATDLHNLIASYASGNGSRGNKNLGYADVTSLRYTPVENENYAYDSNNFEPADKDKGRLARAIFYMGVMYNFEEDLKYGTYEYKGQPLDIIEDYVNYNGVSFDKFSNPSKDQEIRYFKEFKDIVKAIDPSATDKEAYEYYLENVSPFAIGNLSNLLYWNTFEVTLQEVQHNESVYSFDNTTYGGVQGNRNPFVDYPELVEYVYGSKQNEAGSIKNLTPTYEALELGEDRIHHYAYDSSTTISFEVGQKATADKLHLKAFKNDLTEAEVDYSKIQVEDYTFTENDIKDGKDIKVTTDLNELIIHVSVMPEGGGAATIEECTWHYVPTTGNSNDYVGSGSTYVATFGTEIFDVTFGNSSVKLTNDNTNHGVKIGTKSVHANTVKLVSRTSFTDVSAVYFYAYAATNPTYNYSVKVGTTEITGTIKTTTLIQYGGLIIPKASGQVTIEITNVSEALNLCGFGIHY